jgi:hypothetical protein
LQLYSNSIKPGDAFESRAPCYIEAPSLFFFLCQNQTQTLMYAKRELYHRATSLFPRRHLYNINIESYFFLIAFGYFGLILQCMQDLSPCRMNFSESSLMFLIS